MSLMRLLTSGKTLVGLQDARPHYRMADSRSMPKFGSPKYSIRNTQRAEVEQIEAKALVEKICASGPAETRQPELQSVNTSEAARPDRDADERRRRSGPLSLTL